MLFTNDILYEYNEYDNTVIIGDIHGDLKRLKTILIDAKIINENIEWIALDTIVIQLGDQIDSINRDPSIEEWEVLKDIEVIYFTNTLNNLANIKNSKFISLIGNHELMNIFGNFSYVSPNSNFKERYEYFKPQGLFANILSNRPIIIKIGQLLFCHSCFKREHLDILKKHNKEPSYLNKIWHKFILTNSVYEDDIEIFDKIILNGEGGILWNRKTYDTDKEVDEMNKLFKELDVTHMFVGHTPVEKISLTKCNICYVDTGISRSFNTKSYQYIYIKGDTIYIKNLNI